MLLKLGDRGRNVKEVQTLLDYHGYWTYGKFTEYFGQVTEDAVKKFQKSRKINDDGVVGPTTMRFLQEGVDSDTYDPDLFHVDTDGKIDYRGSYTTDDGLVIDRAYLDTDEYVRDYGKQDLLSLFIHHTSGWNNPYATISDWNTDKRGRVGTQYAIGGISIRKGFYGDAKYDGIVVESFPNNYIGWHLGTVGNFNISRYSAGIELNNFGYVIKKGDKFVTYTGTEVPKEMVCDLGYKFRGHQYWHAYTDKQIESMKLLLLHINKIYPTINLSKGIPELLANGMKPEKAFDFSTDAYNAVQHGLWSHTSVSTGKTDVSPQPNMVKFMEWAYCKFK